MVTIALALAGCSGDDSATTVDSATGTTEGTSATTTAGTTQGTTASTTAATTMATGSASMTSTATDATTAGTTTETTGPITATDPTATTSTTDPTTSTTDTTTDTTDTTGDSSTGDVPCMMGTIVCEGDTAKTCDGMGGYSDEELCESVCVDGVGCLFCSPGSTQCNGQVVETCNEQGDAWIPGNTCDAVQGLACDPDAGNCVGACASLGLSYVGCDYYPTVTSQYDIYNTAPKDVFAVAVANTANQAAMITVTRGGNMVTTASVPSGSVKVIELPWVDALTKGNGPSALVADGAYRVRSTQPVTIYQFNPLKATTTNDASLLLPVNTWRDEYMVASWPIWSGIPGWYAVVASQDDTTLTLKPSATGQQIQAGAGVAANGTGVIKLGEGDVLEVYTSAGDVTGTIVSADKPIEVFGGHKCTNVPANISACDHLEEAMFPIDTLSKEYIVVPPIQVPNNNLDKAQMVRVIASQDGTTLTFEPDQPVNKSLAKAGDFVEMAMTTAAFKVTADKKIMVAQYMVGQSAGFGTSDPSMLLTVPTEQYRTNYLFFAATNWVANFVDIIAPTGAKVTVDGGMVNTWKPIGATNFSVAHVNLSNAGDGTHDVIADQKVGISVYGVQSAGSYWFPGGLDLDILPQ